jgi:S1-C subfamily serine protease
VDDKLVIAGLAKSGPAARADLRVGDLVLAVAGTKVESLGGLFRRIWSVGQAGVEVPFTIYRDGRTFETKVVSADRSRLLKGPSLH